MSFKREFGFKQDPFFERPLLTEKDMSVFVNREKELRHAERAILLGKNLLIVGQFGIGKTSFINKLRHTLSRRSDLRFIDVRIPMTKSAGPGSMLFAMALELERMRPGERALTLEQMRKHDEYVTALSKATIDDLLSVVQSSINRHKKRGKHLIFVFDDVDKLAVGLDALAGIRDSLWRMNVVYVFTGNPRQYKTMAKSAMQPFFSVIHLEGLNVQETELLIRKRVGMIPDRSLEVCIDPHVIPIIHKMSQGNPRRILDICNFAARQAFLRNSERITQEDLLEYAKTQIGYTHASPMQEILDIILSHPEGLSVTQIHNKLREKKTSVTRSRVSQLLSELSGKGILEVNKVGRLSIYKSVIPKEVKPE